MNELRPMFFDVPKNSTIEQLQSYGDGFAQWQRDCNWMIGDLARYAESRWPDTWHQVFPEWISPALIDRCKAVSKAYPREENRNPLATWSIHMREANRPDRIQRVQAHVEAGRTSDEAVSANREERANDNRPRWLLAFDTHYYIHRHFFSGAGVETAMQVTGWIQRTVERLKEKGCTDVLCAFEGFGSFRRELTQSEDWTGNIYKDRPAKPDDLKHQIQLTREILDGLGFCCYSVDGYEADDVLASVAKQFSGKTSIVSSDKDLRCCLSNSCNILLDVEWIEDETSGDMIPNYKWITAKQHTEDTGIKPENWSDYQVIMGDNVDSIQGCEGIGSKGASDLIKEFGTVEAVIKAAKDEDERIKPKKRKALIEFESRLEITRKLVTLVDSLPIPETTRI